MIWMITLYIHPYILLFISKIVKRIQKVTNVHTTSIQMGDDMGFCY